MGLGKRILWDIVRAGLPDGGPVAETYENVREGNEHVRQVRETFSVEGVNERAQRQKRRVDDALLVGRCIRFYRKLRSKK